MELVGGLFALMTGGGAAATAGATAAAGSGLMSLQGLATAFGVVSSIGSGIAAYGAGQAEAAEHRFASREEYIAGRETSAALKQELAATISDQAVAFAAGGVDLGSVSVQEAKKQATRDAERELAISDNEALSRSLARRRAARQAATRGGWSLFTGAMDAGRMALNARVGRRQVD